MPNNLRSSIHNNHSILGNSSVVGDHGVGGRSYSQKHTNTGHIHKTLINPTKEIVSIKATGQTIAPNETISFNVTLQGKPDEMIIYGFQWINEYFTDSRNVSSNLHLGMSNVESNLAPGLGSLHLMVLKDKVVRCFKLEDEYDDGTFLDLDRFEDVDDAGLVLGYPDNTGATQKSFFVNKNLEAIDGKLVIKNIKVTDNILTLDIENQGDSTVELNSSDCINIVPITNNTSLLPKCNTLYNHVVCLNDNMLLATDTFAVVHYREGQYEWGFFDPIFITNRDFTEFKIINHTAPPKVIDDVNPTTVTIDYDAIFGAPNQNPTTNDEWTKPAHILAIDATPKYNDSGEFWVAAITSVNDKLLLFDSETNEWTATDIFSSNGITLSNCMDNYLESSDGDTDIANTIVLSGRRRETGESKTDVDFNVLNTFGKNTLAIKDTENGLSLMITSYRGNSFPIVYYSSDNLQTFTEFGPLTLVGENYPFSVSGQNLINPGHDWSFPVYSPIGFYGNFKNLPTFSKIGDDNTIFAGFCQYVGDITVQPTTSPSSSGVKNFFMKSEDDGANWTDILLEHYEYTIGMVTDRFISDDSQTICVIVNFNLSLQSPGSHGTFNFKNNPQNYGLDGYEDGSLLFNMSTDGGATWKYQPGSWKTVINPSTDAATILGNYTVNTSETKPMFVDYNKISNLLTIGVNVRIEEPGQPRYFVITHSSDEGDTWKNMFPYPTPSSKFDRLAKGDDYHIIRLIDTNYYPTFTNGAGIISEITKRLRSIRNTDHNDIFSAFMSYRIMPYPKYETTLVNQDIPDNFSLASNNGNLYVVANEPLQLQDTGPYQSHYNAKYGTNSKHQFAYEITDDLLINIFRRNEPLIEKTYINNIADEYFNAFFNTAYGSVYGSAYTILNSNSILFTTAGTFDILTNLHCKYSEFSN